MLQETWLQGPDASQEFWVPCGCHSSAPRKNRFTGLEIQDIGLPLPRTDALLHLHWKHKPQALVTVTQTRFSPPDTLACEVDVILQTQAKQYVASFFPPT